MDNIDFGIPVRKLNNWLFNFYLNDIVKNLKTINILIRARGGALKIDYAGIDYHISEKDKINRKSKQIIGQKAANYVREGDTIMIDFGTTTTECVRNLDKKRALTGV